MEEALFTKKYGIGNDYINCLDVVPSPLKRNNDMPVDVTTGIFCIETAWN